MLLLFYVFVCISVMYFFRSLLALSVDKALFLIGMSFIDNEDEETEEKFRSLYLNWDVIHFIYLRLDQWTIKQVLNEFDAKLLSKKGE